MRNSLLFNGNQLKKARIYRGYSVGELAELTGVQRQSIYMYESDNSTPMDISTIFKLSQALRFPFQFFTANSSSLSSGTAYFRALLTTNKKYRNQQEQKMEFIATLYSLVEEYISFPCVNLPKIEMGTDPEVAAQKIRETWNLGNGPISDLIYVAEENGIVVTSFSSDTDDVDAFSQVFDINGKSVYFIGYSDNKTSAARIQFDVAHELGHICLHGWGEDIEEISKEEYKEREIQAHKFAAALLLPEKTFSADVRLRPLSLPYYQQLKQKWKVSMAAMIRRAYTLEIISNDDFQMLIRTMQRRSMWRVEPLDDVLTTAEPNLLRAAVMMLLNEKVFTPNDFVEELSQNGLCLYPKEIEELLKLPDNTLHTEKVINHSITIKAKD